MTTTHQAERGPELFQNFDPTLAAVYGDRGAMYSRPVVAIDSDDYAYVSDEHGDPIRADLWDDLAFIDSAVINGQEPTA